MADGVTGTGRVDHATAPPPAPPAGEVDELPMPELVPLVPVVASPPPPEPQRQKVAVVVATYDDPNDFAWLSTAVAGELRKLGTVDVVEIGNNEDIADSTQLCLASHLGFPQSTDKDLFGCLSSLGAMTKTDIQYVIRIEKDDDAYEVSLIVVETGTKRGRGYVKFNGSREDVIRVGRELVQKAFGPALVAVAPAPPPPRPDDGQSAFVQVPLPVGPATRNWKMPVIFGSSAVVATVVASVLGGLAKKSEGESHSALRSNAAFSAYDDAKTYATSANVTYCIAGALVSAAVISVFLGGQSDNNIDE